MKLPALLQPGVLDDFPDPRGFDEEGLVAVGGDLSVEVEPALGTTFVVFLPLANQPTPAATPDPGGESPEIEPAAPPPAH